MSEIEATIESRLPESPSPERRALPWWLQSLVLLIVFAAGGVAGSMLTAKTIHSKMEQYRQQAPIFAEDIVMRLRLRLRLSDQQAGKVQEIVEQHHAKMIRYRNEGSQKLHAEFNVMVDEVAAVLDDNQAQRWSAISDHVRNRYLPASVPAQ